MAKRCSADKIPDLHLPFQDLEDKCRSVAARSVWLTGNEPVVDPGDEGFSYRLMCEMLGLKEERTLYRWKKRGVVAPWYADQCAKALDMHPVDIWGREWTAQIVWNDADNPDPELYSFAV